MEGHSSCSWMMVLALVLCVCGSVVVADQLAFGSGPTRSYGNIIYRSQTTTKQSWWNAQRECSHLGGTLHVPPSQSLSEDVLRQLQVNVRYWIGAVTYPNWIWTKDHAPLYSYVGYRRLSRNITKKNLDGNSAVICHQHCREGHTVFGLRGDECYCLGNLVNSNDLSSKTATEMRCPGNYGEFCGDDDGMSVYRMENVTFVPLATSECCYVGVRTDPPTTGNVFHIEYGGTTYYPYIQSDIACDVRQRLSACERNTQTASRRTHCKGKVCLSYVPRSWMESNKECSLIKVTPENAENLTQAMVSSRWGIYQQYWIGLERVLVWKWINGSDVALPSILYSRLSRAPIKCLAIGKTSDTSAFFFWVECSQRYQSVCERLKLRPSTVDLSSVIPTSGVTSITGITSSSTSPSPSQRHHPSSISNSTLQPLARGHGGHESQNIGVYIGAVVGSLAMMSVVAALIVTYRMKKLCFRAKETHSISHTVSFDATNATYAASTALPGDDNDGYEVPVSLVTGSSWDSPYYSAVPVATVKPNSHISQTWTHDSKDPKQERNCNINVESDGCDQQGTGIVHKKSEKGRYENIKLQSCGKQVTANDFQHTAGKDDYTFDVGDDDDDDNCIYQLAGEVDERDVGCTYQLAKEPNSDKRRSVVPYNTLGQRVTPRASDEGPRVNVYDRVAVSGRDGYDSTTRQVPCKISDNLYSHALDVNVSLKLDSDDGYNKTRRQQRQPRPDDDNYAHVEDFDDDYGVEEEWDIDDDIYQDIEDVDDSKNSMHAEPTYTNTGTSHTDADSDEDACYYNISFIAQGGDPTPSSDVTDGVNRREGMSDA